jgi:hypothetical protein
MVQVDGDTATSKCLMEARIFATGQKFMGEYHDTFERVDGRWMFASREFTMYSTALSV